MNQKRKGLNTCLTSTTVPLDLSEGGDFFMRIWRHTRFNWQEGEDDSVVDTDRECTCLSDAASYPVSSKACLSPGLVGRGWSGALGNFLLNLTMIVADAVASFWYMQL